MSDELRARIKRIVDEIDDGDSAAQAIIDDLGLTMERRFVYATDLARDNEPVTDDMAARVVGKWVEQ